MSGKRKKGSAEAAPRGPTAGSPGTSGTRSRGCWSAGPRAGEIARGAGQVALDGERRGGVAQVRDGAEVQARRARGRLGRPVGGLPARRRGRAAATGAAGTARWAASAARTYSTRPAPRSCAPTRSSSRQARDRRRRARRGGQAGGDKGLPAPGALPRADGGAQRRPGGPVALDHLPLGLGGLRRHDQHGAQAKGRLQAEEARRRPGGHAPPARRSYAAFLALGEDVCAALWEMDTVEGAREDSACLLTLLHRPSRLQLALPLEEKTAGCVADATEGVRAILGADGTRRVFRAVLTDNGAEFSDEAAIARSSARGPARRGCSTATPGAATRRAPASATTSR